MTPEKISCGICRDLLPLVLDGVAAPESEAAVRAHLAACPECRAVWQAECGDTPSPAPDTLPDDARILCRLRRRVRGWLALALAAALLVALFAYTVNGDPISGAWAQQRAIRYAEQRFPGQTFTAPNGSWYSYYFNYSVEVQSDQSPDTHFTVETRKWLWLDDNGTTDAVTNGVSARQRMEQALTDKAQRTFDALSDRSDLDGTLQVELCVEPDADSSSGYAPHAEHYSDVIYLDAPMDEAILDKVPSCLTLTIFWPTAATETDVQTVLREVKQLMEQSDLPMTYYHVTLLGSDGIVGSGVVAANAVG